MASVQNPSLPKVSNRNTFFPTSTGDKDEDEDDEDNEDDVDDTDDVMDEDDAGGGFLPLSLSLHPARIPTPERTAMNANGLLIFINLSL